MRTMPADELADIASELRAANQALRAKLDLIHEAYRRWANVEWADEAADRRFVAVLRSVFENCGRRSTKSPTGEGGDRG